MHACVWPAACTILCCCRTCCRPWWPSRAGCGVPRHHPAGTCAALRGAGAAGESCGGGREGQRGPCMPHGCPVPHGCPACLRPPAQLIDAGFARQSPAFLACRPVASCCPGSPLETSLPHSFRPQVDGTIEKRFAKKEVLYPLEVGGWVGAGARWGWSDLVDPWMTPGPLDPWPGGCQCTGLQAGHPSIA